MAKRGKPVKVKEHLRVRKNGRIEHIDEHCRAKPKK